MDELKSKHRGPARVKVARFQGYKDFYLARKFKITQEQARAITKDWKGPREAHCSGEAAQVSLIIRN